MKDFVLAIIGTVGIAALAMSMNNDKKEIREDFAGGFAFRTKVEKTVKNAYGGENAIAVQDVPCITYPSKQSKNTVEHYSQSSSKYTGSGLGANATTNMPYITTTPHLNQTVNKPSPSMHLPASIRYNPPSLSNMGVTDEYQCNSSVRENYTPPATCVQPYPMLVKESGVVGPDYHAGDVQALEKNPNFNNPFGNIVEDGKLSMNGAEVMVFDRPMTTTLKVGRFAARGCRDLIRGDLPVAPNTCKGWFSTPADPTALSKGALQAMGGESESTSVMNKFMEMYGNVSNVGAGVNLADSVSTQYTAYEMTNKAQSPVSSTISVSSF